MLFFKQVSNPRLLGLSNFQSSNTLQNSTPIHTFEKAPRSEKLAYRGGSNMYNYVEKSTKLGVGMGLGNKLNFSNSKASSPGPARYKIRSIFEENLIKHKGSTILGKPSNFVYF